MFYASLEEVYDKNTLEAKQNDYDDVIKNLIDQNKRQGYIETEKHEPSGLDRSKFTKFQKVENYTNELDQLEKLIDTKYNKPEEPQEIKINMKEEPDCLKILDHISKCAKCRQFIIEKFEIKPEDPKEKSKEEMLDIVIYILSGVFVLYLLESFVNLGKFLKK
jgi:hypothetical protein